MYYDLFFDAQPTREIGIESDKLYYVKRVNGPEGEYWHAHVTAEQYDSLIAEDPKTAKNASKMLSKIMRTVRKLDGTEEECPIHVFGSFVVDKEAKKIYYPDKANVQLTEEP